MGIKYSVNENFFNIWTPTMAYVLGFIYADGTLIDDHVSRGKYLVITNTDKDIIIKIKFWMESAHSIVRQKPNWPNGKEKFLLRIGNAALYKSLLQLGLYPNKSLTITMPKVPPRFLKDFVRGYFDGDGCVHLERRTGITQSLIITKLTTIFTSGSTKFLERLMDALQVMTGIHQDKIYQSC